MVDIFACIPVDLVEYILLTANGEESLDAGALKYSKLARIPRIYRIFRIVRILKIFKVLKYNKTYKRLLLRFQVSSSTGRFITFIGVGLFLVHIMSCFWFLQARL